MEYFKPINYARSTGKVWIESLQVLQSLPSCSDLVVLWHDMKWYEMYSMYRIKCKMAWISWMFFFFFSVFRGPVEKLFQFQLLRRCEASDQPSWELPWWLVCWWHLMPKMPLGSSELQWIFFGTPQKKARLHPQDCQNLPKFRLFDGVFACFSPKNTNMPFASIWISPARIFEFFGWEDSLRWESETKVSQRAHCNCNGPGGGPVDRNCGTFQAPKFFKEVFEKMTDPTLPSHDPWWWWRSRFGWWQFCKESFMGIPKHTETSNFPADFGGNLFAFWLEIPMRNPAAFTNSPGELPGWRHDSRSGCQDVAATSTVRSPLQYRQITLEDPLGLRLGFVMWPFFGRFELRNRICITTRWILSAIHLAKWHCTNQKKNDACPGSFLVREAARAEGLCCRDASTLDKLQYSAFDRKKIGRGSPWS